MPERSTRRSSLTPLFVTLLLLAGAAAATAQLSYSSATLTDDGSVGHDRILDLRVDDEGSVYALAQLESPLDLDRDGTFEVNASGQPMLSVVKYSRDLDLVWQLSLQGDLTGRALRLHSTVPSPSIDPSERIKVWVAAEFSGPVRLAGEDEPLDLGTATEQERSLLLFRVSQDGALEDLGVIAGSPWVLATDLELALGGLPILSVLFPSALDLDGDGSSDLDAGDFLTSALLRFDWSAEVTDSYLLKAEDDFVVVHDMAVDWAIVGSDIATAYRDEITIVGTTSSAFDFPNPYGSDVSIPVESLTTPSGFIADLVDLGAGFEALRATRLAHATKICRSHGGSRIVADNSRLTRLNSGYTPVWILAYPGASLEAFACDEHDNVFLSESSGAADLDRDGVRDYDVASGVREVVFAVDRLGITRWMRPTAGPSTIKSLSLDPFGTLHGGGWFDNTIDIFADGTLDHVLFGVHDDGLVVRYDQFLRLLPPVTSSSGARLPIRTQRGVLQYEVEVVGNLEVGDMRESEDGDEAGFQRADGGCSEDPQRHCVFFDFEGEGASKSVELDLYLENPELEGILVIHATDEEGERHSSLPFSIAPASEQDG